VTDPAIAATSRFGPVGVSGLHQVVVCCGNGNATASYGGFLVQPGGGVPVPLVWNGGTGTGGFPPVIQDTDGYSGTPGDWRASGPLYSLTVPTGLGGTYRIVVEGRHIDGAWWGISDGHPPSPHAVDYVPGHGQITPNDGYIAGAWTVTYDIRVNGASVANVVASGPGGYTTGVNANLDVPGVVLADGDVVSVTATWHNVWDVSAFTNAPFGGATEAVFVLTRTGGGGGKAFLRGHVAL
jgi:hypothetical protein